VELDQGLERRLGRARIGMLALNDGRYPLVNPAAFHYAGGSIWMTTSRYAVKLTMARRDPRAAFVVASEGRSLLFQGLVETYDLRSVGGSLRAALDGPRFAWSLAGYAVKNAPFVGGYLLDLASIPSEWWPHNRVVLRLRVDRARSLSAGHPPAAAPARLPGPPGEVVDSLEGVRQGYLCWSLGGAPLLCPAWWALDRGRALAWIPRGAPRPPTAGTRAALVVEWHHPFRATRMVGACLRGEIGPEVDAAGREALMARYETEPPGKGRMLGLDVRRVTWWRGFHVTTTALEAEVEKATPEADPQSA
jgi:hypothetical protein